MAQVKAVGIAGADLRHALAVASGLAEALGAQDQSVVLDFEFDIAADGLDIERLVRVPVDPVGLARRGGRGQFVDEREQSCRFERRGMETQRMEHAEKAFAAFG